MSERMTATERRTVQALGVIMSFRMFGLFMILPVFALYATHLDGVTPMLVGVAIGVYGLTQALLQLPFGWLSDKIGRKPVIVGGLLIFAAGSIVAALSDSIYGVIAGRALQGAGAIAAALMALTADLTREEHRTKAMAVMGVSIGAAFALALVFGPILNHWIGVPGIFWTIAALALAGITILLFAVPTPAHPHFHRDAEAVPTEFVDILRDSNLLRLDFGIMVLHAQLSAMFLVVPLALTHDAGLATAWHWSLYLPVMLGAMGLMVPFIIMAEKRRQMKAVFMLAVALLAIAQIALVFFHGSLLAIGLLLLIFFLGFNILEASLPSLVSKTAPSYRKGTAMGVYTTAQFLGIFIGGLTGGWVHHEFGITGVFWFGAGLATVWLGVAATMQAPSYLSNYMLNVGAVDAEQARQLGERLRQIPGVAEALVIAEDRVAYLRIDKQQVDLDKLDEFSVPDDVYC
jgi:MFS family permease